MSYSSTVTFLSLLTLLPSALAAAVAGTTYNISPASHTSKCVIPQTTDNGAQLVLADCDVDNAVWEYTGVGLKNTAANICVDLTNGGAWSGNKLQVWECFDNNANQAWSPTGAEIKWTNHNLCWDLTDGDSADGTPIQVWTCFDHNTNQMWDFLEVEEVDPDCDETSTTAPIASATATATSSADSAATTSAASDETMPSVTSSAYSAETSDETSATMASADASSTTASADMSSTTYSADASSMTSADAYSSITSADPSQSTNIGGDLLAGNGTTSSHKGHKSSKTSASMTKTNTASATGSVTSWSDSPSSTASASWTDSASTGWSSSATGSSTSPASSHKASATSGSSTSSASSHKASATSGSTDTSGYLQTSGTSVVDPSGNKVVLKGTNLGGWLVWEDWMCGMADSTNGADRYAQLTLENRFGFDKTAALLNAWQDNWLVSSDFDNIAALGFNVVRLPFSYRNFQKADGTWISGSADNVDFTRLDWAIAQAKQRNIYVIPVFHIWQTQDQQYSLISENSDDGQAARDKAAAIWKVVGKHYLGESTIAAYDAINEPTGSWGDLLQQDLYTAIRSVDPNRIIIMESISTNPSNYGWKQVMYSLHEYLMMGDDLGSNQNSWNNGAAGDINTWNGYNIPTYVGEFMADGDTLTWMLEQMNNAGVWWSGWTYKTVNMNRWGLYNFGGGNWVNVGSDSYSTLMSKWSNMGSITEWTGITGTYQSAAQSSSWKRTVTSEKIGGETRRSFGGGHAGRSRRTFAHARVAGSF